MLNFGVVGARQSFQFFKQVACFLENNKALFKFRHRILFNFINISINYIKKNDSIKTNLNLTTGAILTIVILKLDVN